MAPLQITQHARERMRQYGYTRRDLRELTGQLRTRPDQPTAERDRPTPGRPLRIGFQPARNGSPEPKDVLLGITGTGRTGICVVTVVGLGRTARVVTLWDPARDGLWRPNGLGPTKQGLQHLPPTIWAIPSAATPLTFDEHLPPAVTISGFGSAEIQAASGGEPDAA
jgi:hypothetical protein